MGQCKLRAVLAVVYATFLQDRPAEGEKLSTVPGLVFFFSKLSLFHVFSTLGAFLVFLIFPFTYSIYASAIEIISLNLLLANVARKFFQFAFGKFMSFRIYRFYFWLHFMSPIN